MAKRYQTYKDFWPYYLSEHRKPNTRRLHFLGTASVIAAPILAAATGQLWLLAAMPLMGYGPAWIGHFGVEKNKPATFTYPLWSLISDFRMFGKWASGGLEKEFKKHGLDYTGKTKRVPIGELIDSKDDKPENNPAPKKNCDNDCGCKPGNDKIEKAAEKAREDFNKCCGNKDENGYCSGPGPHSCGGDKPKPPKPS